MSPVIVWKALSLALFPLVCTCSVIIALGAVCFPNTRCTLTDYLQLLLLTLALCHVAGVVRVLCGGVRRTVDGIVWGRYSLQ